MSTMVRVSMFWKVGWDGDIPTAGFRYRCPSVQMSEVLDMVFTHHKIRRKKALN